MAVDIFTTLIMGTLCMMAWSVMYKENFWYRIAEDLTIGVMGGYVMASLTLNTFDNYISPLLSGEIINIVPILLGIMMWTQLSKNYRYLARTPLSFITGIGSAIAMKGAIYGNILVPIISMSTPPTTGTIGTLNHIIAAIATITTVAYFFFTIKPIGPLKYISTTGRIMMMIGFGSVAGSSVLSNTTFLYNRTQWFVQTPYAWIPLVLATVILVIDIVRKKV
ncbi:MAG: hypothetical protein JRJ69_00895 [Deltaproteobacteria bacterium]|nr:hypothetical protein [Deltaproteobacteria bacterium]